MCLLSYHFVQYADKGQMNASYVTGLLTIASMNSAWYNVVVNALMVAQARRDIKNGSSDLQVYSWSLVAIGGICGSIISAFFTEYLTPNHSFVLYLFLSFTITFTSLFINPAIEP
jgi:hypothetical protein